MSAIWRRKTPKSSDVTSWFLKAGQKGPITPDDGPELAFQLKSISSEDERVSERQCRIHLGKHGISVLDEKKVLQLFLPSSDLFQYFCFSS